MTDSAYKTILRRRYSDPTRTYYCDVSDDWLDRLQQYRGWEWDGFVVQLANMISSTGSLAYTDVAIGDVVYNLCIPDLNVVLSLDPTSANVAYRDGRACLRLHALDGLDKTDNATRFGYRCIHVYDWDDIFKLALLLQPRKVIYARECAVVELSTEDAHEFIQLYHIQGRANSYGRCYGLCYMGELVMVMVFGKPHFATKYQWQLNRFCTDPRYQVVGGASRLFTHFVRAEHPNSIVAYCDRSKFVGDVYYYLGMRIKEKTQPTIMWSRGVEVKSDYAIRRMGHQYSTSGPDKSFADTLLDNGWLPIYNCGQIVYEWCAPYAPCIYPTAVPSKRQYTRNLTRYSVMIGTDVQSTCSTKSDAIKCAQAAANSQNQIVTVVKAADGTVIHEVHPKGGIQ